MRIKYWSNSKFADWVRGVQKPPYLEWRQWDTWNEVTKLSKPLRYFLAEEGLDRLQDIVMFPNDVVYSIRLWIENKYINKTHALTSSSLKRGDFHEFETRMLHCLFDELVNFVECEKAWMAVICESDPVKYPRPKFRFFKTYRNRQAGLDYLNWEASVRDNNGELREQAKSAKEILELYHWWTETRKNRPDIYEESGWNKISGESNKEEFHAGWEAFDKAFEDVDAALKNPIDNITELTETAKSEFAEKAKYVKEILDKLNELEESYNNEDEEMLIRLVKVRMSLWT